MRGSKQLQNDGLSACMRMHAPFQLPMHMQLCGPSRLLSILCAPHGEVHCAGSKRQFPFATGCRSRQEMPLPDIISYGRHGKQDKL